MEKHFVTFYSPGTFVHEENQQEIDSWDVDEAVRRAKDVVQRYDARPFGFRFSTRTRGEHDLDSHESAHSGMYYLGGTLLTLADVKTRNDRHDDILIRNMESNHIARVIQNDNSWRITVPFNEGDILLDVTLR